MNTNTDQNRVRLALSSGEVFQGAGFGALGEGAGEVVFNTAMSGYEESITDPSYMGQILIQTAPMIGNTGSNERDMESRSVQVSGMVVHEYVDDHSNYRASSSLHDQLAQAGVPGISGVDTRALTSLLRSTGVVQGLISSDQNASDQELVERARAVGGMSGTVFEPKPVSAQGESWDASSGAWGCIDSETQGVDNELIPIGLIDCGAKENILRCLVDAGCEPRVLPMSIKASEIKQLLLDGTIHGVFLSNGPGDPGAMTGLISMVRELLDDPELQRYPIFGICLGHQILSLAHGATTYKLKFGHRGINHPIVEVSTGRVSISSQNHGFAVNADSCDGTGLVVSHTHLNDDTVAGVQRTDRPVAGMQFHPEASPGPHDACGFFERFAAEVRGVLGESPLVGR